MSGSLIEKYQQFQNQGSGWQFDNVENFDINIDPIKLLSGSSYIPLSKVLGSKKVIVNVKNEKDNECFKWAVTSAVYPKEIHPERLNEKMREDSENFCLKGIGFLASISQVNKFEKQNPYTVNIFAIENDKVYPLRIS